MSARRASLFNGPSMDTVDTLVTLTAADANANSSSKIMSSSSASALSKRPTVLVASPSEVPRPLNGGHSLVVVNGRPPPPPLPRPRSPLRPASIFLPAARQGRRAGMMLVGKQASFLPMGRARGAAISTGGSSGSNGGAPAQIFCLSALCGIVILMRSSCTSHLLSKVKFNNDAARTTLIY